MSRRKKQPKTLEELLEEALVPKEEQPYELPENWVWVRLGSVLSLEYGKSLPKKKRTGSGYPVYGSNGIIGRHREYLVKGPSIIVGRKGSYGEVRWSNNSCWPIDTTYYVKNSMKLSLRYVYHLLQTLGLKKLNRSTAIPGLNREDAYEQCFPLPPLPEQKRIVDKVESLLGKIDEARELIQEARDSFEQRRAAILDQAFRGELTRSWREQHPDLEPADRLLERIQEEKARLETTKRRRKKTTDLPPIDPPCELPEGWKWVRLEEITMINPGKPKNLNYHDDIHCSFIPMAAVDDYTGTITIQEKRPFGKVKKGYTYFEENDVLFAKITPCMENGKATVAKGLINKFGFGTTEFHVIRCSQHIHPGLIYQLVRSDFFRKQAKAVMTGAVGQQRVPKQFLEDYLLPLPPYDEQWEIVKLLESLLKHEFEVHTTLSIENHHRSLTQSILTQAFCGELGTNDPAEESALELLKRTLAEQHGLAYESPAEEALQVAEQGELYPS